MSFMHLIAAAVVEEKNEAGLTERIVLELACSRTGTVHSLCFYDHGLDTATDLTGLVRKAQHWKTRIDAHKHPGRAGTNAGYPPEG